MSSEVIVALRELLSRADEVALQDIVGANAVAALTKIDVSLGRASKLRQVATSIYKPVSLVRQHLRTLLELASPTEAEELCRRLGLTGGDPFVLLRSLKVATGSARERTLLASLGVDGEAEEVLRRRDDSSTVRAAYGLFPHQRQVRRRLSRYLEAEASRALVHMPTGAGKTRTMVNAIADHLRTKEQTLVLWLAHSEELCEQAFEEFCEGLSHLSDRDVRVYRWWGDHEIQPEALSDGVIVAGLAKVGARIRRDAGFLPSLAARTSLVVMDEAHQAIAPIYQLILETMTYGGTSIIGLSATPGRTWNDLDEDARLAAFFNHHKVGMTEPFGPNPVEYLINNGFLAKPEFETLNSGVGYELTEQDLREIESGLDIPRSVLRELGTNTARLIRVSQRVEQLTRHHSHILLFAPSVESAKDSTVVLSALGIEAYLVTSATPTQERRESLARYKASTGPVVMCNFGVLTTGFDAPRTSAVVIARPTTSLVLYFQMLGRALRGPHAGGNEEARVVTVADIGLPGFGDVGEAFLNWEDVW